MDLSAVFNCLSYFLVTIIAELRFIFKDKHGIVAPVWIMTLFTIFQYGGVNMFHDQLIFKFFIMAGETQTFFFINQKICVLGRMVFMTEDTGFLF